MTKEISFFFPDMKSNKTVAHDQVAEMMMKLFQLLHTSAGGSMHEKWTGGFPCNHRKSDEGLEVTDVYKARWGGFGGGGGGCKGGGGGGGFIGEWCVCVCVCVRQ